VTEFERTVERGAAEVARLRGEARFASRAQVRTMAKRWTKEQKTCRRARKHAYTEPITAYEVKTSRYHFFYESLACANGCGVWIEREMNRYGQVYWTSAPHYPEGYLSEHGRIEDEARFELNLIQFREAHPRHTVIRRNDDEHAQPRLPYDDAAAAEEAV
jgi:hypothetical protein